MPTYLKNTPGSQSLGRQRSRATPGSKICNHVFCQLNEIVGINNNVCTFLVLSVLFCLYFSTCAAQLKEVAGISWNELMLRAPRFTTEIDLFSEIEDSGATEASLCITCTESVNNQVHRARCTELGAQNQVHTGRCSQVLQEGGRILPVKDGLPRHPWERPSRPRPLVEGSSGG